MKRITAMFDLGPLEALLQDPQKRRLVMFAAGLIGLAIVLAILRRIMRWFRRSVPVSVVNESLVIELSALPTAEPGATRLMVYHIPVRLAVVVIAPLGRDSDPPTHSQVPKLLDRIVPGLASALSHDQTIVKIWPRQLSATGFAPSLLRHVRLPGDKGRRTPWCLVAGRTTFNHASYAVGLALGADSPNNLGLIAVESEHQWLDVVRMDPSETSQ
jgi:hypothetical protein